MRTSPYLWVSTLPNWRKVVLREQLRRSRRWEFLHEQKREMWFALPKYWDLRYALFPFEGIYVYFWAMPNRFGVMRVYVEVYAVRRAKRC